MADVTVTAANVLASANAVKHTGIAGTTITAGQTLYKNSADNNRLYLADADASPQAADCVGVAIHGAAAGQPITYTDDDPDFTPGATLSLSAAADGGVYVLSGTPGGFAPIGDMAAGDYPVILMVAKSTTKAVLKIVKSTAAPITA